MKSYWDGVLRSRMTRRRSLSLIGTTAGVAAALSLIGCGDDDDGGSNASTGGSTGGNASTGGSTGATTGSSSTGGSTGSSSGSSSLFSKPVDTTSTAVKGGNFNDRAGANSAFENYGFDQNLNGAGNPGRGGWVYPHFVKSKLGTVDALPTGDVEGDFAESFELSPDGLTLTFKVRPGITWAAEAPTNGRTADATDMAFSYNRWADANPRRSLLVNDVDPNSPVTGVEAPDAETMIMHLAFPYSPLLPLLAVNPFPLVYPKEVDELGETRSEARGAAAWTLDEYSEANFIRFKRNPDWYIKDRPFLDTYTINIVPDYAAGLAQFKTGALDRFDVTQEDILPTKKDVDKLIVGQDAKWRNNPGTWLFFGFQPDSPFRDDRVRKAMSMSMDRDTYIDVFSGRDAFEAAGLPVSTSYYNFLGAGYPDYFLDPQGSEIGPSGQFFTYNPDEAKKMLEAAGYTDPVDATWNVADITNGDESEAIRGGIASTGLFSFDNVDVLTYRPDFNEKIRESKGDFEGTGFVGWGNNADPDHTLYGIFAPSSAPNWQIGLGDDPKLTEMVTKQRQVVGEDRAESLKDLQRYLCENMFCIPQPGQWLLFTLHQPWTMNFDYHISPIVDPAFANISQTLLTYRWFDKSKKS